MIPHVTYGVKKPLVTKAMQIYASRDRRQSLQELNMNNKLIKANKRTPQASTANMELYDYSYGTIELQNKNCLIDVRV